MTESFAVDGYAIVTVDGMIADENGVMPDSIKYEADQRFFSDALDRVDLVVHGRHSHEGHVHSPNRRRFWMTRSVATLAPVPGSLREWLWNPEGVTVFDACRAIGLDSGTIAVLGGTSAYDLFLPVYHAFHLSRAGKARQPGGTPVFSAVRNGFSPEAILARAGLAPEATLTLDAVHEVTITKWVSARALSSGLT